MRQLSLLAPVGLSLLLVACSGGGSDDGSPVAASGERTTVTATLGDDMAIELSETQFSVGETVTFEVTNSGSSRHELYLGDSAAQEHHAEEMAEMGGMGHDEPGGVSVEPGATETLEYTFDRAGEVLAGCHEPGHYEAGMVATITVVGE